MKLKLNIQRITIIVVVLFIVAGVLIVALDWHEMRLVIGHANWLLLLPSLLLTASSYACLSYGLVVVFRTFGIRLGMRDLMEIGFVSNVVTYLMNVGGVTGVSFQFVLLKRHGLATEDILAPSLFQLYFSSLLLIALLPVGLFHIVANHSLSRGSSLGVAIAAGIVTLLLIIAGVIVFSASARAFIFRGVSRTGHFLTRRNIEPALSDFDMAMTRGIAIIRQRPQILVVLLLLAIADWTSTVAALWFCFDALGNPVGLGTLLTGFSLGIIAGFISMVPGGLGVQEGSMAGIYTLLGVPIRTAALAAILFRIVYYFLPFLVSLAFYRHLLQEKG